MGGLSGDFKRTMSRIGKAMTSSGSSGICLLVVFIVIVFVVLWRVIRLIVCWNMGMDRASTDVWALASRSPDYR